MTNRGRQRAFEDAIPLPDGRTLVTLHDAATYITALPKQEAAEPAWQAAIEALMLVVDLGGPTMFARTGVMRALAARETAQEARESVQDRQMKNGLDCNAMTSTAPDSQAQALALRGARRLTLAFSGR